VVTVTAKKVGDVENGGGNERSGSGCNEDSGSGEGAGGLTQGHREKAARDASPHPPSLARVAQAALAGPERASWTGTHFTRKGALARVDREALGRRIGQIQSGRRPEESHACVCVCLYFGRYAESLLVEAS